ncbi:DUF5753 domain-containing protein [Actinomadura rudentiformis]|uniref:DUF5753 domain-containing protein n=1 Tax=Actinomadura rudentiformis TaxID=359158 RepID=A0A6H9YEC2_9ACTN|nr:DUF5753 domain-containing protein [Actinomadura rudentiformis]KAB2343681.1 hypothetical protein F8566_33690 [Actinomadura rudentiformis]
MTGEDRARRYAPLIRLLVRNRRIADNPSYATIERTSIRLTESHAVVCGVAVQVVPSSSANDLLRRERGRRSLKWDLVASLWAVLYWIARDDQLDVGAMHSLEELRRLFDEAADQPGATAHGPSRTIRTASRGAVADGEAPAGKGSATRLDVSVPADAALSHGMAEMTPVAHRQQHQRQQATGRLLDETRQRRSSAWWNDHDDIVPESWGPYLTLEQELSDIRAYAPRWFPALLQTSDYARHAIRADMPGIDGITLERLVGLRMRRQQLLRRSDPPSYWAIVNQRVLQETSTPAHVMRPQLKHLITLASFHHIRVQFVADDAAEQIIPPIPMAIMRFAEPACSDMVYMEHEMRGTYHWKPSDISHFHICHSHLVVKALEPDETVGMLLEVLDRLQPGNH